MTLTCSHQMLRGIECWFVLVYFAYIVLKATAITPTRFLKRWFGLLFIFVVGVMVADLIVSFVGYPVPRFSRPLRPILLLCLIRTLRHMARAAIQTLPKLFDMFLLLIVLMIVYGIIGLHLFSDMYA